MKLRKTTLLIMSISLLMGSLLPAQEFRREEVEKTAPVRFTNRTNQRMPAARRTLEVENGKKLAKEVAEKQQASFYGVNIKRVFDKEQKGMGADIISLDPKSTFGHINRVQRVLTGYLMQVFNYKQDQAAVLSRFVLYYNATHRQNMDKVKGSYSAAVAASVDPAKVGIDTKWQNWAGQTQILLPLTKNLARPDDTDLDKKEVTDNENATNEDKEDIKKIIEETRTEDKKEIDKKIEEAEKKTEEINKKIQELQKDPEANKEEIKKAEEEKKQVEEDKKDLENQKEDIKKEEEQAKKEENATNTTDTGKTDEGATDTGKTDEGSNTATDTGKTDEGSTDSGNTSDTGKTDENKTDSTTDTGKTDETATDTKKEPLDEKNEISENVVENKILFMRVLKYESGGHYNNELWWIETNKDDALSRSPYNNICSKSFLAIPDAGVLVIGYNGQAHNDEEHHLVMLDKDKLEKKSESKENIHWRSPLEFRDGKIWAIIIDGGKHYIGRFNPDLTLEAKATEDINPYSDITFTKEKLYITGTPAEGQPTTIRIFNRADLKLVKTIDSSKLK
ncbi:MAG: hypothetical protein KDK39_07550 [Leptospiraceae bacterium]|nr:hypothetical protein [Leptospiraceae bacterium]